MGAKDKRERERLEAIERRKKEVIEAAKIIFAEKSIDRTTMQDIAQKAEVGVASVYRYFTTKTDLVLGVAMDYFENELFNLDMTVSGNGLEQTTDILNRFIRKMIENPAMMVFMEQLDAFLMSVEKDSSQLNLFNTIKYKNIPVITSAIEKGKQDGSIRPDIDTKEVGMTCIEIIMALLQKCMIKEYLGNGDESYRIVLEIYKDMLIKYLQVA